MEFYVSGQMTFLRKSTTTFGTLEWSVSSVHSFVTYLKKEKKNEYVE